MDNTPDSQPVPQRGKEQDWAGLIVAVLLYGWLHLTSLAIHWVVWAIEQDVLIMGADWPVWVWPAVALLHAAAVLVPLVPLAWFWRSSR